MKMGTQIAYIPNHAEGNIEHPDVEFGFVVSARGDSHFCRYWHKGEPGELRTVANSELTPTGNLVMRMIVPQETVEYWLEELGYWGSFSHEEVGDGSISNAHG